jgi:hypothetical protein
MKKTNPPKICESLAQATNFIFSRLIENYIKMDMNQLVAQYFLKNQKMQSGL